MDLPHFMQVVVEVDQEILLNHKALQQGLVVKEEAVLVVEVQVILDLMQMLQVMLEQLTLVAVAVEQLD
jgi:peptidoglycan hydrolase CwlO-like protein